MMYNVFDAHCDTLYELYAAKNEGSLINNNLHFSIENTKGYNKYIQVLALWANPEYKKNDSFIFIDGLLDKAISDLNEKNIKIVLNSKDLKSDLRFKAILGIEGGDAVLNDINNLVHFYNKGIRVLTLTWNGGNYIGEGCLSGKEGGLYNFGVQVIKKMNELSMVIDVSHLNEEGFYDVLDISTKPIIASHSNSREVCPHLRNLSDKQFTALIRNGGVSGINLCPDFLSNGKRDIDSIVSHIDHFMALGGEYNIGLGCDFDGVFSLPEKISSNSDLYLIFNRLLSLNYSEEQVKNISYNNFYRVFEENLNE